MVQLAKEDIQTQEVLDWQGLHLFNFAGSTCSKKIRIFLNHKNVEWTSHPVNLIKRENNTDWFLGINPRGLVPVLVHDGQVHIESNDILDYLEKLHPTPTMIPKNQREELTQILQIEDQLHTDLRNLTMRFTAPTKLMQRSSEELQRYATSGSGNVGGKPDSHRAKELEYWRNFSANRGITDTQVIKSCERFQQTLDQLENRLKTNKYLLGSSLSLADIAWFVTINRILLARYPLQKMHPRLWVWRQNLLKTSAFAAEAKTPFLQSVIASVIWIRDKLKRKTLCDIAGL